MLGVRPLRCEINDLTNQISQEQQHVQAEYRVQLDFLKSTSIMLGQNYLTLVDHYNSLQKSTSIIVKFLERGLYFLKTYANYSCNDSAINYEHWFTISTFYLRRIQLHQNGFEIPPPNKELDYLNEGLEAVNQALRMEQKTEALFRKFLFLQLLQKGEYQPTESPIEYLHLFLDNHPDKNSDDYMQHAQVYGRELAKTEQFELAREWFVNLIKQDPNAISYLYLGKILNKLNDKINALADFERAAKLDPQNLEIQLWLNSQKIENVIYELRLTSELPKEERLQEIVDIFNQFCSVFNSVPGRATEQTSTFIPLSFLASHFYFSLIPTMANILTRLQQFKFALDLYQRILEAYDIKEQKFLDKSGKPYLHVDIGTLHFFNKDLKEAKSHLREAIRLDPRCAKAYQNLVGVYSYQKDQEKLSNLWNELSKVLDSEGFKDQSEELSAVLFNFGAAYALLGIDWLQKAEEFYLKSLEYDPTNMYSLLHLSRVLIVKKDHPRAVELLDRYLEQRNSSPFEESSERDFQFYFCFACALGLSNQLDRADQMAREAGKTHFDEDKAQSLQRYLYAFKNSTANNVEETNKEIKEALVEAVRKIQFESRIGKLINKEAINISKDDFIGYHGTADFNTEDLIQEIRPIRVPSRQFKGNGFYIAEDRDMASYFAFKKVKEVGRGKPVLLKVYASQNMVGQNVPGKYKIKPAEKTTYDFVKAPIGDFERYSQYYFFENNLRKLQIRRDEKPENVDWDDKKYNKFQKKNRHDFH